MPWLDEDGGAVATAAVPGDVRKFALDDDSSLDSPINPRLSSLRKEGGEVGGRWLDVDSPAGGRWLDGGMQEGPAEWEPRDGVIPDRMTQRQRMQPDLGRAWQRSISGALNTSLVPFSKLTPSAQTVMDALQELSSGSPDLTNEEAENVELANRPPDTLAKTIAGTLGGINRGTESLTTPFNIATLGAGALPKWAGALASGVFAGDMGRHIPDLLQRLNDAVTHGDAQDVSGALVDLLETAAFAGSAAKHGIETGGKVIREKFNPEPTERLKPGDILPIEPTAPAAPADTSAGAMADLQAALRGNQLKRTGRVETIAPPPEVGEAKPAPVGPKPDPFAAEDAKMREFLEDRGKDYSTMTDFELQLLTEMGDMGARSEFKSRQAQRWEAGHRGEGEGEQGSRPESEQVGPSDFPTAEPGGTADVPPIDKAGTVAEAPTAAETITGHDGREGPAMPAETGESPVPQPPPPNPVVSVAETSSVQKPDRAKPFRPERPPDLIDWIADNLGSIRGKKHAKRASEDLYPASYDEARRGAARRVVRSTGTPPDVAAQRAYDAGMIGQPTADALWEGLRDAGKARRGNRSELQRLPPTLAAELERTTDFQKTVVKPPRSRGKDVEAVKVDELYPGDEFTAQGVKFKVAEMETDPDTGDVLSVTLEDGKRFGTQRGGADTVIHLDKGSIERAAVPEFEPSAEEQVSKEGPEKLNDGGSVPDAFDYVARKLYGREYAQLSPDQRADVRSKIEDGNLSGREQSYPPSGRERAGEGFTGAAPGRHLPEVEVRKLRAGDKITYADRLLEVVSWRPAEGLKDTETGTLKLQEPGNPDKWAEVRMEGKDTFAVERPKRGKSPSPSSFPEIDPVEAALNKLKIDTGPSQLHAFGLIPEAWNGLIEVVRHTYRAGRNVKRAIDAGLQWLRENAHKDFDEAGVRAHLGDLLREDDTARGYALADEVQALREQVREARANGGTADLDLVNRLYAAEAEFHSLVSEAPRGPGRVDRNLHERPGAEPEAGTEPVTPQRRPPQFQGPERLPRGNIRDLFTGLREWRRKTGDWWRRSATRGVVTVGRDAADNRAGRLANEASNHVRLTLNRAFGEAGADVRAKNDLREYALTFVVEADGERGALSNYHDVIADSPAAETKAGKRALAAIRFADTHWDKFQEAAAEYKTLTEVERETELNDGLNSNEWQGGYVYHRWSSAPEGLSADPSRPSAAPTPFRKSRTVTNYAEGIASGGVPKTLNALELLASRVADGQRALNEVNWIHGLREVIDPVSQEPIVVGVVRKPRRPRGDRAEGADETETPGTAEFQNAAAAEWITVPEVPGYVVQKLGSLEFAVKPEYAGLLTDLTSKSWFEGNEVRRNVKRAIGFSKSVTLLFDTFHLGRLAAWKGFLTGSASYERGATLLDYTTSDLRDMVQRGEIPKEWGADLIENRRRLDLAVKTGFNVGQILDNAASDWVHNLPGIGTFNKWLFGQYQRGAMAEAWLIEFGRTRRMFPDATEEAVARKVSEALNNRFGNLGRQGLFRSKTGQDIARIVFLAPQWNEALIRSELGAVKDLVRAPYDSVQQRRLVAGTLLRSAGGMALGTFIANQILNYAFRGKPTWENDEEGWDKKISAYIPDAVGNGPGFFLNPLALPAEYTHLIANKLAGSQDTAEALWRIVNGRTSGAVRSLLMLASRKDELGRSLKPGEVLPAMAKALVPAPIPASGLAAAGKQLVTGQPSERFPGQFQKQLMASVGVKTDQAPNPEQRVRALARDFNKAKGIVPSAEFFSGDFYELTEALRRGNQSDAQRALEDLMAKKTRQQIAEHYRRWVSAPYTGQQGREREFLTSLSANQRAAYLTSREARQRLARSAMEMVRGAGAGAPAVR